jgi:type IV secretory pathway TrbL component
MVNIILWNIEFAYLLVLATFLLPFALFPPTKFLSTGVWPALAGQGVKLFCASFIITVSNRIYGGLLNMSLGENAASFADNSLAIVPFVTLAAIVYCYFILRGPDIAKAMIVGQPTMDSPGTHMILSTGSKGLSAFLLTRSLIGGIGAHGSSRQTVNNYYKASSYRGVSEAQSASRRS